MDFYASKHKDEKHKTIIDEASVHLSLAFMEVIKFLPKEFHSDFRKYAYISGSSIHSLINKIEVNDYDFFLSDKDFAKKVHDYYEEELNRIVSEYYKDNNGIAYIPNIPFILTDNAITFDKKYQIVTKYSGTPEEVIGGFDFVHLLNYFDGQLYTHSGYIYHILDKELVFNPNARSVASSLLRMTKFLARGMTISKETVARMLMKLQMDGFTDQDIHDIDHANDSY